MESRSASAPAVADQARGAAPVGQRPRVLIFVIAYQAESTLCAVLERIPRWIFENLECEVLVVDDASLDRTFEIGCEYRDAHPELPMTVLRNEVNQGYGGNQKVGYAFAIAQRFDLVAMLHGDAQYAPEELPKLVQPLLDGEADAVFGSRMMSPFGALKGGMPLYKFAGNRILTTAQNFLLGSRLTEFHSGYRVYATRALERIPFALNSNDFHFDTEIIIQLLNAKLRIKELPIPTYYGDEICRVNGMRYAKDVMVATLKNALHRSGLLYQRRFDTSRPGEAPYTSKLDYASSHSYALAAVPARSTVLHFGEDYAGIVDALAKRGCSVELATPLEADESAQPPAAPVKAEYMLLLDVIEHMSAPEAFLDELRRHFDFQTRTLVLTTPNVAFVIPRLMLLLGQFNYGARGVLDRTHRRLFTFRSARQLLEDAGFRIKEVRGVPAPFPLALGQGWLADRALALNRALIRLSKTLFAYQIFVVAETTPDIAFVLARAQRSGRPRTSAATAAHGKVPPV